MDISRSYKKITLQDLQRLATIVAVDRTDHFRRKVVTGKLYSNNLFAVALCQGSANHYLDGKNGIKDLDVWSFYRVNPERQFPPRRRAKLDFGDPKFGKTEDSPHFTGRRIDHMGRSIKDSDYSDPVAVLQRYLSAGITNSAYELSKKAVVMIEPPHLLGAVAWPLQD